MPTATVRTALLLCALALPTAGCEYFTQDSESSLSPSSSSSSAGASGSSSGSSGSFVAKANTLVGGPECPGYTNSNYMDWYSRNPNRLDPQLNTQCAAAFSYYAVYVEAGRQGRTGSSLDQAYEAFSKTATLVRQVYQLLRVR